jgi:hypothetical protein
VTNTHELTRLNADVEWHHAEEPIEEQRLAVERASRLPSRPVDVFRDLGMTEKAIASYLWRWHCAWSSIVLR